MNIPYPLDTTDWIVDAYHVIDDGVFQLYIFDQEDGTWSLTWYDSRLGGYELAYQTIYAGFIEDVLMALDTLTKLVGITDHSRSIMYMRHKGKLPSNIRIPYVA